MKERIRQCKGFDWDEGNSMKNWELHHVSRNESEQVFFNEPLFVMDDEIHSQNEKRWFVLGQTDFGRLLFVVFTIRGDLIRVISARDMHKKERKVYNEN